MSKWRGIGRSLLDKLSDAQAIAGRGEEKPLSKQGLDGASMSVPCAKAKLAMETNASTTYNPSSTHFTDSHRGTVLSSDCSSESKGGKSYVNIVMPLKQEEKEENARNKEGQGKKYDGEKVRMELLDPTAITALARVLTFGARKYGDRNWQAGFSHTRAIGAILRHTTAYLAGQTLDPESGESHMAHAMCNAMFLLHFEKFHPELDDRPKAPPFYSKGSEHETA